MSLQGSLRQLGLADVLQTALAGRRGNLILRRGATRAVLHIAADELYLVEPDPIDPAILLEGFVHRGLIPQETVAEEQQREQDPLRRVDALLERNVISSHELDAVLRGSAEDAILDLLTWQKGEFRFEEDAPVPERGGLVSRVGVDIGGMLLRAAQRLDEHNAIAEALGLEALLFMPDTVASPPVDFEGDPTPTVHALLDGHRVIDEVAMLCGLTRFAVLRAIFACVRVGAARLPSTDELAAEAQRRIDCGHQKVARGLLLQWTSLEPGSVEPLERLIDLAKLRNSPEEQADALMALGQVHFRQGQPQLAQEAFRALLALRPGDENALQALCKAADASGDHDLYRRTAIDLARTALAADEAERAAEVLESIVAEGDAPLQARVLRARALIRLKAPDAVVAEAEAAAAAMGRRARRKEEKEAAAFFRDAIATLAPERSDLLKRFRTLREGESRPARKVALLVALLAIAGSVGFVVLRDTPAKMLARIQAAWDQGNQAEADRLLAAMNEEFPDSPEAETVFQMQVERQARNRPTQPKKDVLQVQVDAALSKAKAAMGKLPAEEAREALAELLALLRSMADKPHRQQATVQRLSGAFTQELARLARELRKREDHLSSAERRASEREPDLADLRRFIKHAREYREGAYCEHTREALELVNGFMSMQANDQVLAAIRRSKESLKRYERSIDSTRGHVAQCRRALALADILRKYAECRKKPIELLVHGDLEGARALYEELRERIASLREDVELRDLTRDVERRSIPQFVDLRLGHLDTIDALIASAKKAEGLGDLETAVDIFTQLMEEFYWIRFESVIEMPMGVQSTPSGATVRVNGKVVGQTPMILHYRMGKQSTIRIDAAGFESVTDVIGSQNERAKPYLRTALRPQRTFTSPVDPTLNTAPVALGGDLLLAERNGRMTRIAGVSGKVKWARKISSLEGVRARPLVVGRQVYVPFLDGNLSVLDVDEGQVDATLRTGRPVGHPARLGELVLVATLDGRVIGLRGRHRAFEAKVEGRPSAGVVTAHGAAWIGFSDGHLGRIDRHGGVRPIALAGREDDVVGITAHADGLLVSKADGTLHALDTEGKTLWTATELGDTPGNPARAGAFAAVADSRGRILLFDVATGSMRGQISLDRALAGSVLGHDNHLIALTQDGRLWIYDPATEREICHASLGGSARFPPAILDRSRLAVSVDRESITVIELGSILGN